MFLLSLLWFMLALALHSIRDFGKISKLLKRVVSISKECCVLEILS